MAHDLTGDNPTSVKEWIPPARVGWPPHSKVKLPAFLSVKLQRLPVFNRQVNLTWQRRLPQTLRKRADGRLFRFWVCYRPTFMERSGGDLERLGRSSIICRVCSGDYWRTARATDEQPLFGIRWLSRLLSDVEGDFNFNLNGRESAHLSKRYVYRLFHCWSEATLIVLNQLKTNIPQGQWRDKSQWLHLISHPVVRQCIMHTRCVFGWQAARRSQRLSKMRKDSASAPKLRWN